MSFGENLQLIRKKNQLSQEDLALWGAQNTFLAWYRNLEDVTKEIAELQAALDAGAASYTLQYSVKCKQNLLRTIED